MSIVRIALMSAGGGIILIAALGGFGQYALWGMLGAVLVIVLAAFAKDAAPKDDREFQAWKAQRDAAQRKDWETKINKQQ